VVAVDQKRQLMMLAGIGKSSPTWQLAQPHF